MFVTWMLAATFWVAGGEPESSPFPGESPSPDLLIDAPADHGKDRTHWGGHRMLRIQSEAAEELGQIVQYLEHRGGGPQAEMDANAQAVEILVRVRRSVL